MATTPAPYSLPYPEPADDADVPYWSQALAERVAALIGPLATQADAATAAAAAATAAVAGVGTGTPGAGITADVSGPDIMCSGDSLTKGSGSAVSYPAALQTMLLAGGYTGAVRNLGVGGEGSRTIAARTGARPMLATFASGTIPASGGVTVTLAGDDGAVNPLDQGSAGVNPVLIAGVYGTLSLSGGVYTFTRTEAGDAVPITYPQAVITEASRTRRGDVHIMEWGQNDATNDAAAIIGRQHAAIEHMIATEKRWLVLGLTTSSAAYRAPMEAQFLAAFGRRFVNTRAYLSSPAALTDAGITPTADDLTAQASGSTPPSLRSDVTHLNQAGYAAKARLVHARILELGWASGDAAPPTTPGPEIILFDDFERAFVSGTTLGPTTTGGQSWAPSGTAILDIDTGRAKVATGTTALAYQLLNLGTADAAVQFTLPVVGAAKLPVFVFRYVDASNLLRVRGDGTNWVLSKRVAGAASDIATALGPVANGDTVKVTHAGTTVTVFLNTVQVWTGTVTEHATAVRCGIGGNSNTVDTRWDNVTISTL